MVLASEEMDAHEALEAISEDSKDMEFLAIDLGAGGTMQLLDDRFLVKGSSGSAGGGQRKGSTGG